MKNKVTVKELIKQLEKMPQDAPIITGADHLHTIPQDSYRIKAIKCYLHYGCEPYEVMAVLIGKYIPESAYSITESKRENNVKSKS